MDVFGVFYNRIGSSHSGEQLEDLQEPVLFWEASVATLTNFC